MRVFKDTRQNAYILLAYQKSMKNARNILIGIILFCVLVIPLAAKLYVEYLWFVTLQFSSVFLTILYTKIGIVLAVSLVFFLLSLASMWYAARKDIPMLRTTVPLLALFSLVIGFGYKDSWMTLLQYLNQVPFNLTDPIFTRDIAFHIFSIPVLNLGLRFFLLTTVLIFFITGIIYVFRKEISFLKKPRRLDVPNDIPMIIGITASRKAKLHLSFLGSLFFIFLALRYYIKRFDILHSTQGIVSGAGYTDVFVTLPVLTGIIAVSLLVAGVLYIWPKSFKKKGTIALVLAGFLALLLIGQFIAPAAVQYFGVLPNEMRLERPYIEHNIKFTRFAYGLDKVKEFDFSIEPSNKDTIIKENIETLRNIRLWDPRPLKKTYNQLQEIRLYYDFHDVDIDRYTLNNTYRQVMLSPRELASGQLSESSRTWVNTHLVFTHGYGLTMSPVNEFNDEGLPNLFIKDLPPKSEYPELQVTTPQIYYGEETNDYVLVNTNTKEFDYPKGDKNQYTTFNAKGGVKLTSFWKKIAFALYFKDIKLMLSSEVTSRSKVLFNRNIQERVEQIAPFLYYDADPYMVVSKGKLFWIQDAYTVTDRFPYAEYVEGINYIRNSVKVIIDAYSGETTFYIRDMQDPIIQTYKNIFPTLFKNIQQMPEDLQKHLRYPEDLFSIQAYMFGDYHMQDPMVFYNKEDSWDIPNEVYGEGREIEMMPYYIIMKLPNEDKEQFILMTPFTPLGKANMIGWMAARSDQNYGELIVYKFPKESLIYGPMQIEARIDQDEDISEQITLWDQRGSTVIRGNLLVIPIDHSLLYIEPLYLIAEKTQLPELKRVILSYEGKVVMEKSMEEALNKIFKTGITKPTRAPTVDSTVPKIDQAIQSYERLQVAMKQGNWVAIGTALNELQIVLSQIKEER